MELFDVKISYPWMFTAQEVFDCISKSEPLQEAMRNGSLYGEYRDEDIKYTSLEDVATIHLNNIIFGIKEIYMSQTNHDELRMKFSFDDGLPSVSNLLRRLYMADSRIIDFVIRGFTETVDGKTRLTRVITVDGMLNNPRTYYNSEGGSK